MNLNVQNDKRMVSKLGEKPHFAKTMVISSGLRRDFVVRHGDLSRFHHC